MRLFIEPQYDPDMETYWKVVNVDDVIEGEFGTYAEAEEYCDKGDPVD